MGWLVELLSGAAGAVILGIFVAYAAMFGWDKFTAIVGRLKAFFVK